MKGTVLQPKEIVRLRYPLPKSLVNAAGMLKGRLPDALKYQKAIRREWQKRTKKTARS